MDPRIHGSAAGAAARAAAGAAADAPSLQQQPAQKSSQSTDNIPPKYIDKLRKTANLKEMKRRKRSPRGTEPNRKGPINESR